tara:strand:- start:52 stop:219 length:168 start_codon:yes stop_codon:yes gene_type:complete
MILKTSLSSVQDNNLKDLDKSSAKYPINDESITEQNILSKKGKTVHRRRDLDSLG